MVLPFLVTYGTLYIVKIGSHACRLNTCSAWALCGRCVGTKSRINNFLKVDDGEKQVVLVVVEEDLVLVYRLVQEVLVYMKNMMSDVLSIRFYLLYEKLAPGQTLEGIFQALSFNLADHSALNG